MKKILLTMLSLCVFCGAQAQVAVEISDPAVMARRFADSEMKRFPKAWNLDHGKKPFFGYTQGLGSCAMLKMWKATGNKKYYEYVEEMADTLVSRSGDIDTYKPEAYNLDFINSGKYLFDVYAEDGSRRYRRAMDKLIKQLSNQPRTTDGGFWHKLIYQHQMWLDGLYMASPFMAQYGYTFGKREWVDEALQQVITIHRHTFDPATGLCHHAWDESASQRWSDEHGHSPNFWGRSEGWYLMALVDILDYVPEGYMFKLNTGRKDTIMVNGHDSLVSYIRELADVLPKYQRNGLWSQVLDCPDREGNWPEASVTAQFMYGIAKAVNMGYLDKRYIKIAEDAYNGLQSTVITDVRKLDSDGNVTDKRDPVTATYGPQHTMLMELPDGTLTLTQCCAVGGLGGKPYRDGSFSYYINERVRDNDAKATGPFIMGCLELAAFRKQQAEAGK